MAAKLVFRVHALRRMFERQLSVEDVEAVIDSGETIEDYPDDTPYPSRLVLGWRGITNTILCSSARARIVESMELSLKTSSVLRSL